MSNRLKQTLFTAVRGVAMVFVLSAWLMITRMPFTGVVAVAGGELVLIGAITWTVWWWHGDSEKAVALRAKAEAKKAARSL